VPKPVRAVVLVEAPGVLPDGKLVRPANGTEVDGVAEVLAVRRPRIGCDQWLGFELRQLER
jgi:hypothetical protein